MITIKPSATILEEGLSNLSIYQRIDRCTSVCYQRPPKPTEEEAQAFVSSLVRTNHWTPMEMVSVHLIVDSPKRLPSSNYLTIEQISGCSFYISGSIRAFIEAGYEYDAAVYAFLAKHYPLFFPPPEGEISSSEVRFARENEIPSWDKRVAVRFIIDRTISHQLVRHRVMSFLQESQRYCKYDEDVVFIEPQWIEGNEYLLDIWSTMMLHAEEGYQLLRGSLTPQKARAVLPNSTKTELIMYGSVAQWWSVFDLRCFKGADPEMRRVMIPLWEDMRKRGWKV